MNRFTKILLGLAVVNLLAGVFFLTGIVDISRVPGLYATLPAGVVCLGMFLISFRLEEAIIASNKDQDDEVHASKVIPLSTSTSSEKSGQEEVQLDRAA